MGCWVVSSVPLPRELEKCFGLVSNRANPILVAVAFAVLFPFSLHGRVCFISELQ